jgi:rhodanese-related sulfurtransferase
MDHSPGFLKIVNEARSRVKEISVDEARVRLSSADAPLLVDVREDAEWIVGRAVEAVHLGKGVLERDLEKMIPDSNREIMMYCGGGFRSVLAADVAQKMGYKRVSSVVGGHKKMVSAGWKMVSGQ